MDEDMNNLVAMFTLLTLLKPDFMDIEEQRKKDIKEIENDYWSMGYRWDSHNEPPQGMMKAIEIINQHYDNIDKKSDENNYNCNYDYKPIDFCDIKNLIDKLEKGGI